MSNSVDAKDVKDVRHTQTQQSCYPDLQVMSVDTSVQDSARLDVTNMFHWCPAQSLASCLLVSVATTSPTSQHFTRHRTSNTVFPRIEAPGLY